MEKEEIRQLKLLTKEERHALTLYIELLLSNIGGAIGDIDHVTDMGSYTIESFYHEDYLRTWMKRILKSAEHLNLIMETFNVFDITKYIDPKTVDTEDVKKSNDKFREWVIRDHFEMNEENKNILKRLLYIGDVYIGK